MTKSKILVKFVVFWCLNLRLRVRVIPNSKRVLVREEGGVLVVYVDAPPVKGKANKRLVQILAKHFGVSKSKIQIVSGEKSREKIVEIQD